MTKCGYKEMEEWYNVKSEDIVKNGGSTLLSYHNSSPSTALQSAYPEHRWELDKFKHKPRRFWEHKNNHKQVFDQLMNQLGYTCMEDWYSVTYEDIVQNGGSTILNYCNNSPSLALQNVYPEHCWDLQKFKNKSRTSWENIEAHKECFDRIMNNLGYNCMDDWYNVTHSDIVKHRGGGLLLHYNNSPSSALQNIYPEHKWELERFKHKPSQLWETNEEQRRLFLVSSATQDSLDKVPIRFWNDTKNQRKFFEWRNLSLDTDAWMIGTI